MADAVSGAIDSAVKALAKRDCAAAQQVVDEDEDINSHCGAIERAVMELIATQQPMATDLREILAISAISADLERIGDHAKGVATIALRLQCELPQTLDPVIPQMAEVAREMLVAMLDAFINRDRRAAREIAARDDELDNLYDIGYRKLIDTVIADRDAFESASRQLWVAKSLERIGDHITNIGERIVFVDTGEIVELNP